MAVFTTRELVCTELKTGGTQNSKVGVACFCYCHISAKHSTVQHNIVLICCIVCLSVCLDHISENVPMWLLLHGLCQDGNHLCLICLNMYD